MIIDFYQPNGDYVGALVFESGRIELTHDLRIDFRVQPFSKALRRPVSYQENPWQWVEALVDAYQGGFVMKAVVRADFTVNQVTSQPLSERQPLYKEEGLLEEGPLLEGNSLSEREVLSQSEANQILRPEESEAVLEQVDVLGQAEQARSNQSLDNWKHQQMNPPIGLSDFGSSTESSAFRQSQSNQEEEHTKEPAVMKSLAATFAVVWGFVVVAFLVSLLGNLPIGLAAGTLAAFGIIGAAFKALKGTSRNLFMIWIVIIFALVVTLFLAWPDLIDFLDQDSKSQWTDIKDYYDSFGKYQDY